MDSMVSAVVGFVVWVVANVVYADKRRRSARGFARFLAFWMGLPVSFFTMLVVEEGSQPVVEPPADDEEALLAEVRRARRETLAPPPGDDRSVEPEEES